MQKRILVLTYYWPPSGGAGVQRWLKMVKYLHALDWEPVVYTVDQGEWPIEDPTLNKDIPAGLTCLKRPIFEPYAIYKWFTGRKSSERINPAFFSEKTTNTWRDRLSLWIRANFFIPDARCFWIKPSIRYLADYVKTNPVNFIISTGPPHSMHRIALGIKRRFPHLIWIADFRDPWTDIDYMHHLKLMFWARKMHLKMEREVLEKASGVLCVGQKMSQRLQLKLKPLQSNKFKVLYNGFDESDRTEPTVYNSNSQFIVSHIGTLVKDRNPEVLWRVLHDLKQSHLHLNQKLIVRCIGKTDAFVKERVKHLQIEDLVQFIDYLPHAEIFEKQKQSDLLLLVINNTPLSKETITGKVFEYLHAQKPILVIGPPDGEASELIQQTQSGICVDYSMTTKLTDYLEHCLIQKPVLPNRNLNRFSRSHQAAELVAWLEQMRLSTQRIH